MALGLIAKGNRVIDARVAEGRAEGRVEGRVEALRRAVERALTRGGRRPTGPELARLAEPLSPEELEAWFDELIG